jgi:choline dehydrogenase-like flavoprotein
MTAPVEELPGHQTTYDYVVVGGGTAGCVIASRLAEELPSAKILLVEGGGSDVGNEMLHDLKRLVETWGGDYDWDWSSVPQPNGG